MSFVGRGGREMQVYLYVAEASITKIVIGDPHSDINRSPGDTFCIGAFRFRVRIDQGNARPHPSLLASQSASLRLGQRGLVFEFKILGINSRTG